MESSGEWLRSTLMRVCCDENGQGVQLDADTVSSLVSYCELASPDDAIEYLINIVSHESSMEIAEEYYRRRATPASTVKTEPGTSMHAYHKPQAESAWSAGTKNSTKASKQKSNGGKGVSSASALASSSGISSTVAVSTASPSKEVTPSSSGTSSALVPLSSPAAKPTKKGRKGTKAVTLAEMSKMIEFRQGKPCDCQATKHALINNCLSCGKIICEQEGEGPCNFCGALVLKEVSTYAGLEENALELPISDAEAAALAYKDRLVEYDRNSVSRTTVIDDQSDFFEVEGDAWISEEEKQQLRKKQEELEKAEEERRKRVIVTIDLLGRKVVMGDEATNESILLSSTRTTEPDMNTSFRVKASPDIRELPVYVETGHPRQKSRAYNSNMAISGRVQYEDTFKETLLNRKMELLQVDHVGHSWQKPRLMAGSGAFDEASEGFECA